MSIFDITASQERAKRRLKGPPVGVRQRQPRSDRGVLRLDDRVRAWLADELGGWERPVIADVVERIDGRCRAAGLRPPSRATVYKLLATLPTPVYRLSELPPWVRDALYNLVAESEVPAHQVAFYCFNYGDLRAISFAAGLPWLALYQAGRLPGYRARSRGLFEAVALVRGV